jgi:hypothetical protein
MRLYKMRARENSPGLSTAEAAAEEVALGARLTGGDVERVLQRLDAASLRHPLGARGLPRLEGLNGTQRDATVYLLCCLFCCGCLHRLGWRARLLCLVLDEVLRADDAPLLGLVGGGRRRPRSLQRTERATAAGSRQGWCTCAPRSGRCVPAAQRGSPAQVGGRYRSGRPFRRAAATIHARPSREAIAANRGGRQSGRRLEIVFHMHGQITPSSRHISLLSFSCMLVDIYLLLA